MGNKKFLLIAAIFMITGFAGGALVSGLAKPQCAKAAAQETVTAQSFQVADADGKVKLIAYTDDAGQPNISLMDNNAKVRAIFALTDKGEPIINLQDKNEKLRGVATVLDEQGPAIGTYDASEKTLWSAP